MSCPPCINPVSYHSSLNKDSSKNLSRVFNVLPNTYLISHGGSGKKTKTKKKQKTKDNNLNKKKYWI